MLSNFRSEDIPQAYKERHTRTVSKALYKPKPVFKDWLEDTPESLKRSFDYDVSHIQV